MDKSHDTKSFRQGGGVPDERKAVGSRPDLAPERFWSRVRTGGPTECWPWTGGTNPDGYGRHFAGGRYHLAHRVAYELAYEDQPPVVMHVCDNRSCCNPAHLRGGNQQENIMDRQRKDRQAKGSRNGRARLDEARVAQIKRLLLEGVLSQAEIARLFGVSKYVIYDINVGKTWRHVQPAPQAAVFELHPRRAA